MIDRNKIEEGVRLILEGMGEQLDREGLLETPSRVARMYEELFAGMDADAGEHLKKVFHADSREMVVERDISFYSTCEHHMLPFFGKVHIAYLPAGKVAGLSKLARTVEVFARRLQIQEQMTVQIAEALMQHLAPEGVLVLAEAEHLCMTMRGVKKPGSTTVTVASRGIFTKDAGLREEAMRLIRYSRG